MNGISAPRFTNNLTVRDRVQKVIQDVAVAKPEVSRVDPGGSVFTPSFVDSDGETIRSFQGLKNSAGQLRLATFQTKDGNYTFETLTEKSTGFKSALGAATMMVGMAGNVISQAIGATSWNGNQLVSRGSELLNPVRGTQFTFSPLAGGEEQICVLNANGSIAMF